MFKDSMVHGILQFTPSITFTLFFINARAEISIVESHFDVVIMRGDCPPPGALRTGRGETGPFISVFLSAFRAGVC